MWNFSINSLKINLEQNNYIEIVKKALGTFS